MPGERVIILKFGGSVLEDESSLARVVTEVDRHRRRGFAVVAVTSAFAGVTDSLAARCDAIGKRLRAGARASVLSLGELEAASVLGAHLDRSGIRSCVLTHHAIRLIAAGDASDATPESVDVSRLRAAIARDDVVVVPGFLAGDTDGRTVLLGRGGSDLTAIFLASALCAERCVLVKDVDGLYDSDPSANAGARRFAVASWAGALATDGSIVQHKAVRFARARGVQFELGSFRSASPTLVGGEVSRFEADGAAVSVPANGELRHAS